MIASHVPAPLGNIPAHEPRRPEKAVAAAEAALGAGQDGAEGEGEVGQDGGRSLAVRHEPCQREPRFCEGCLPDSETGRFFSTDDIGIGTAISSDEESVNGLPHLPQRC